MIFIGPRSREDAGFDHSYDVLVDSYEAEEDLNDPTFYKMAGRVSTTICSFRHSIPMTVALHPDGTSYALHCP